MESAYAATLPPRERRLAGRLEGFGDIVFGFAVSQCALQLPMVGGHAEFGGVASLAAYFGTYAVLALLWITFHNMMSGAFRPSSLDLLVAFAYLALVTLMPYALYWMVHRQPSLESARLAVAQYAVVFALLLLFAAAIMFRNLRRGWHMTDERERRQQWYSLLRRAVMGVVILSALVVDLTIGPFQSSFVFMILSVAPRIVKLASPAPPARLVAYLSGARTL